MRICATRRRCVCVGCRAVRGVFGVRRCQVLSKFIIRNGQRATTVVRGFFIERIWIVTEKHVRVLATPLLGSWISFVVLETQRRQRRARRSGDDSRHHLRLEILHVHCIEYKRVSYTKRTSARARVGFCGVRATRHWRLCRGDVHARPSRDAISLHISRHVLGHS